MIKICENCGKEYETDELNSRFCSTFCAHSYSGKKLCKNRKTWVCLCGKIFNTRRELNIHHKTCEYYQNNKYRNCAWSKGLTKNTDLRIKKISDSLNKSISQNKIKLGNAKSEIEEILRKQKISEKMKGNTNWMHNKRHGNGKKGKYQGIYCDSSWELAFVVYHLEHNLNISRCKEIRQYKFRNIIHKYIPDFITDEGIIEIKGRFDEKSIEKSKQNQDIIIYNKEKMKPILNYIISKYGNNFWKILYNKN